MVCNKEFGWILSQVPGREPKWYECLCYLWGHWIIPEFILRLFLRTGTNHQKDEPDDKKDGEFKPVWPPREGRGGWQLSSIIWAMIQDFNHSGLPDETQ